MNIVFVPVLQLFIGMIWLVAALLTILLFGPIHLLFMISSFIAQQQKIKF